MVIKTGRKPTTVEVSIIDLSQAEAEVLALAQKAGKEHEGYPVTECEAGFKPHGFVETPTGLYALSSEGVGSGPITKEKPYEIGFYPGGKTDKGKWGSSFPGYEGKLGPGDLRKLATGEKVNLAEFIRSFGARLERNYDMWRKTLEEV